MSQRAKDLLDEAAAGVEPRSADPVATVVRRGRAVRARAVAAGGLAVVAVLTGGTVAGVRLVDSPPPGAVTETAAAAKPATRPDRPPNPRVERGRIVAGDVSVAVPKGWKALPIEGASCGLQSMNLLFGEGGNPWGPSIYCATAQIEVLSTFDVFPWVHVMSGTDPMAPDAWQIAAAVPYRMATLDGGAPAWFRTDADGSYRVVLPWSRVEVTVRGDADLRRRVLDSLRTGRWEPDALVLPKATEYAALTVTTVAGAAGEVKLTAPARIKRALALLREAAVVEEGDSCAREDQPTVALEIGRSPANPNKETGSFVISLAEGCHEVVSEEGGRARLDAASLTELGDLFGVRLP
jgi:hypothetical protein